MPKYRDGMDAKPGDLVCGVPYNTGGKAVAGVVLQVVENAESCNLVVGFVRTARPATVRPSDEAKAAVFYDTGGRKILVDPAYDYGASADFELLERGDL